MKFVFSCVLIFVFFQNSEILYAQEGIHQGQLSSPVPENFFVASPDVMAFQKHNILPTNLYTGKVDVTIPLFEIMSGDINVPITLTYNTGGIRVDDIASSVGLGWNLNAGGSIVRSIKDIPDNDVSFSANVQSDWDLGIYIRPRFEAKGYNRKSASAFRNFIAWSDYNRHAVYTENPGNSTGEAFFSGSAEHNDVSPDIFYANAPGLNTKFISINNANKDIFPDNNSGFNTTFLDGSGNKMQSLILDRRVIDGVSIFPTLTENTNHYGRKFHPIKDFFEFNILSISGHKYKFDQEEVIETFYAPLGTQFSGGAFQAINASTTIMSNNYSKKIHTWNLSTIEDPLKNKRVQFNYYTYSNANTEVGKFFNVGTRASTTVLNSTKCYCGVAEGSSYTSGSFCDMTAHTKRKRLSNIIFDEGSVNFYYDHVRKDYLGEMALTQIIVNDKNFNVVKRYNLIYDYMNSKELCSQPECKRLILKEIHLMSFDGTEMQGKYSFEYDETEKFPKRGSLQQDYLGYYNNNGVTGSNSSQVLLKPHLWFYQGQGQHSVLPFHRYDMPNQPVPGNYSVTPNEYAVFGLLKKIIYPSGGSSQFEYENNTFYFQGFTYLTGGARIKSQIIHDGANVARKLSYSYREINGESSGYFHNIPVYGYLREFQRSPFIAKDFVVFDKPKSGLELTSGSFIGYSRIIEIEQGIGQTVYTYTSPKIYPNIQEERQVFETYGNPCVETYIAHSAYPGVANRDQDFKTGKLLGKEVYNANGTLVLKEQLEYQERYPYEMGLQGTFSFPSLSTGDLNYGPDAIFKMKVSSLLATCQQFLLDSKATTEYFNTGSKRVNETYTYNATYPLISDYKKTSGNSELNIRSFYSASSEVFNQTHIPDLLVSYRLSDLVKEVTYKDGVLVGTKQANYGSFNSKIFPKSISTSKGELELREDSFVDRRDSFGNIVEFHSALNIYTCIIWGYAGNSLPIAKIENISYSALPSSIIDSIQMSSKGTDEQVLQAALSTLRTHPSLMNAKMTTYTYRPLIGISSITDANGLKTTYHYNKFGQLEYIRDNEGMIVKEFRYKFKS